MPFIYVCNMMPKCAGWIMLSKRFHGSTCGAGGGLPFSGVLPAGAAAGAPPPLSQSLRERTVEASELLL